MVRLLADEDFNNDFLRALRRRSPTADVLRVQDVGLSGRGDMAILAWAASERRVVLTHDVATLVRDALSRVGAGLPMAGVLVIPQRAPAGLVVDDLLLIVSASATEEWADRVTFLPFR